MKPKKQATPTQLKNLRKGQEIKFKNDLRRKGIPRTITKMVQVSVPGPTKYVPVVKRGPKITFALFNSLVETQFFPLEINRKKEDLNLRQILNYILSHLDHQNSKISFNKSEISRIIEYINSQNKKHHERLNELEKRISKLEEENKKLKKQIGEKNGDETTNTN